MFLIWLNDLWDKSFDCDCFIPRKMFFGDFLLNFIVVFFICKSLYFRFVELFLFQVTVTDKWLFTYLFPLPLFSALPHPVPTAQKTCLFYWILLFYHLVPFFILIMLLVSYPNNMYAHKRRSQDSLKLKVPLNTLSKCGVPLPYKFNAVNCDLVFILMVFCSAVS